MPSSNRPRVDRDHTYWTLTTGRARPAAGPSTPRSSCGKGRSSSRTSAPSTGSAKRSSPKTPTVISGTPAARGARRIPGRSPRPAGSARSAGSSSRPASSGSRAGSSSGATCPEHGLATGLVSSDADAYANSLLCVKPGTVPFEFRTRVAEGCPKDCGLCPSHEQHTCLPIIEITERCDLDCPVCLVGGGRGRRDPKDLSLEEIGSILDGLIRSEGTLDLINLSGGEPTLHGRIRDVIDLCARPEILRTTISTNGLRLAEDDGLLDFLVDRNVLISLQFDGFSREVYPRLRGADILSAKLRLLDKLEARKAPLSLVVTARKNANEARIRPDPGLFLPARPRGQPDGPASVLHGKLPGKRRRSPWTG